MLFVRGLLIVLFSLSFFFLALLQLQNPAIIDIGIPFGPHFRVPLLILLLIPITLLATSAFLICVDLGALLLTTWQYYQRSKTLRGMEFVRQAEELFAKGYTRLGLDLAKRAVQLAPKYNYAHVALGNMYRRLGRVNDAIEAHERGIHLSSDKSPAILAQVQDLELSGEHRSARRLLQRLQQTLSGRDATSVPVLVEMRRILSADGNIAEALEVHAAILKQVRSQDPHHRDIELGLKVQLARAEARRGKTRAARALLRGVLKVSPGFLDAYLATVDLLLAEGKLDQAFPQLLEAYRHTRALPVLERLLDLALHLEARRFQPYFAAFQDAFRDDLQFTLIEGRYFLSNAQFGYALGSFERLAALDLPLAEVYESLALCQEELDPSQSAKVIGWLRQALRHHRNSRTYYTCNHCGHEEERWHHECRSCGGMNTFESNLPKLLTANLPSLPPPEPVGVG